MSTSGQTVQDSHAERHARRPGMHVRPSVRVIAFLRMLPLPVSIHSVHVQVRVTGLTVCVLVGVNAMASRAQQAPDPDPDQHQTHQSLAPVRKQLDRNQAPQQDGPESDEKHAARVAETPEEPGTPWTSVTVCGQGRDGGQMIRPGQHVHRARSQPGENRREQAHLEIVSRWHEDPNRVRARSTV